MKEYLLEQIISSIEALDLTLQAARNYIVGGTFFDDMWANVAGLSDVLKPFCYIIITICLLIELAQVAAKVDVVKWEHGLKICIKMVFTKLVIDIAPDFLKACYEQASEWIVSASAFGNISELGPIVTEPLRASMSGVEGFFTILLFSMTCGLISFMIWICGIVVQAIAWGRMFELLVYLVISPIPCAFFPLGDGSGGGMSRITSKYFRTFIAVCLQGLFMVLCIQIFYMIVETRFSTVIENVVSSGASPISTVSGLMFNMLLFSIILIMSVSRCGQWARNIMDVS